MLPRRLGPTNISTTTATWYTAPEPLTLTDVMVTNWGGASASVNLYLVPGGSTFANGYKLLGDLVVAAHDVARLDSIDLPLIVGDVLAIRASTTEVNIVAKVTDEEPH